MSSTIHRLLRASGVFAAAIALAAPASAQSVQRVASAQPAATPAAAAPTWAEVAPIFFDNCVQCHQPEGIGPMSLLDYQTARRYAARIRTMVATREMPPWHIDRSVGIQQFKNDASLSDAEIQTVLDWVQAGTPQGDPARAPAPPELPPADAWQLESQFGRPPDLIIRSTPFSMGAEGLDNWWEPEVTVTGLDGPRWIMANETKPSYPQGRKVVHHANTTLVPAEGGRGSGFTNFGIGKPYDIYPENTGQRIAPGDKVGFNIHYYPYGEPVEGDVVEVGLWFFPEGQTPRFATEGDVQWDSQRSATIDGAEFTTQQLVIPPHGYLTTQGVHVLDQNTRLHSCRGHMHFRGSAQQLEAVYPDGHTEVLCRVNWNSHWHITYLFEDNVMPLLPKGTVLLVTAWYDNTVNNPVNPDPDQWVIFGRRTGDEMSHMWIGATYLSDEDFEFLKAQRTQPPAAQQQ
jgi:mono/diheme cytochrome c family protein